MSATRKITRSKSSLPAQPSLEQIRKQAKERLAKLRADGASAQLSDAQLLLAREYGFSSWRALKAAIEAGITPAADCRPPLKHHPVAARYTTQWDRGGMENAFFNVMALGLFLTCIAMSFDFRVPKPPSISAPVVVDVEILH